MKLKESLKYNWVITLTIPAFKKVQFKSQLKGHLYSRAYGSMKHTDQRKYIDDIMYLVVPHDVKIKYIFETHDNNGRLHLHGVIFDVNEETAEGIRFNFYSKVGIKSYAKYDKISHLEHCKNLDVWLNYMLKHPIKSIYDDNMNHYLNLDNGIVKIDCAEDKKIISSAEFETLRKTEYLFNGKWNKYIIEL